MRTAVLAVVVAAVGACASASTRSRNHFVQHGLPKAEFDFNCPRAQLTYVQIITNTFGVRGCGQQARYELVDNLGWVMDAASRTQDAAEPAPAPAPN